MIANILRTDEVTVHRGLKPIARTRVAGLLKHRYQGRACQLDAFQAEAFITHFKT